MIDTHTHLYLEDFENGGKDAVERAIANGVCHFVFPNTDLESVEKILNLHQRFPECTSIAIGLHPTDVADDYDSVIDQLEEVISSNKCCAVGEVGIDLYWDQSKKEEQKSAFIRQLRIADKKRLPVIIHNRDALAETLDCIDAVKPTVPLIFHSFTGSPEDVATIREHCNPYFGINGVVTYKNAPKLRDSLSVIGLDRILLETDSPYLSPVPMRGKRNESANLVYIRDCIASVLGVTSEEVEAVTEANARTLFCL